MGDGVASVASKNLQQQFGRPLTLAGHALGHCGQVQHRRHLVIVDSHHGDVAWHVEPGSAESPESAYGEFVVLREYGRRQDGPGEQLCHGSGAALESVWPGRDESLVDGLAGGTERLLITSTTLSGGDELEAGIVGLAGDQPNSLMLEMEEMVDRTAGGAGVIDAD